MKNRFKKNVIIVVGFLFLIFALVYFFGVKSDFEIDIEHSMYGKLPIDIRVYIDGKEVKPELFTKNGYTTDQAIDVFSYNGLIGWSGGVKIKLSKGFHKISIESDKLDVRIEDSFFIWRRNENSLIQYIDDTLTFQILDEPRLYY